MNEEITNEQQEVSNEVKLAATYKRLLITVIFSCLGWPVFIYGFNFDGGILLMLLGGVIVSAPILWIMARGGGLKGVFKTDEYEVITTYSDGRKVSDGGTESFLMGLIVKAIGLVLIIFLGCLITIGILIWLIIRYIILYMKVEEKPSFIKSGFPIMLLGFIIFCASAPIISLFVK